MAQPTPEQVFAGYATAARQVRERILKFAALVWSGSPQYRDADVDRIVAQVTPKVIAGQLAIANLTAAYIAAAATLRLGDRIPAAPVALAVTQGRGVPVTEVYRRPATAVYTELSNGKSFEDAVKAGALRMADLVSMDLQMAKVRQADASFQRSGAKFFRRVLTGRENCALCVIASTQQYRTGELMPVHPGCDCDVDESEEGADRELDMELLASTHEQVERFAGISDAGGRAPDYRQLIVSRDHGEYGPTLAWRDQKFAGPSSLAS